MPGSFRFSVLQAMESWAEPGYEARLYTETKGRRKLLDIYCKQSPHTVCVCVCVLSEDVVHK